MSRERDSQWHRERALWDVDDEPPRPALAPGKRTLTQRLPPRSVQRAARAHAPRRMSPAGGGPAPMGAAAAAALGVPLDGELAGEDIQAIAQTGVAGAGQPLPHLDRIQRAFGPAHDLSRVRAHVGGDASAASHAIGARAYATGSDVAFDGPPDLHTAAHEAAHVVQQRQGVSLAGGVGQAGDPYEVQADQVADAVVAGRSASDILGNEGSGRDRAVQRREGDEPAGADITPGEGELALPAAPPAQEDGGGSAEAEAPAVMGLPAEVVRQALAQIAEAFSMQEAADSYDRSQYRASGGESGRPEGGSDGPTPWWADGADESLKVAVPIDRALLDASSIYRAFQIRIAEAGAAECGVRFQTRMGLGEMVDAASRAGLWSRRHLLVAGKHGVSDRELRATLEREIVAGRTEIPMRLTGFRSVLTWFHEVFLRDRGVMMSQFKARQSGEPERVLFDFFAAHVNGLVNVVNSVGEIGARIGGGSAVQHVDIPKIPKISYRSQWGANQGAAAELGVELGVTWVTGGWVAQGFTRAAPAVMQGLESVTIAGVRVGPHLLVAAKAVMAGAAVSDAYSVAMEVRDSLRVLGADDSTDEERHNAVRTILLTIAGAGVGKRAHDGYSARGGRAGGDGPRARIHRDGPGPEKAPDDPELDERPHADGSRAPMRAKSRAERFEELALDPDTKKRRPAEAEVALGLEDAGVLPPEVRRPIPGEGHGGADFVDGADQGWDVKAPRSRERLEAEIAANALAKGQRVPTFDPGKRTRGEFETSEFIGDMQVELNSGSNVIIDTRGLTDGDLEQLRQTIAERGWENSVRYFPR